MSDGGRASGGVQVKPRRPLATCDDVVGGLWWSAGDGGEPTPPAKSSVRHVGQGTLGM